MIADLRDWRLLRCTQVNLPSRRPAIEGSSVRPSLMFEAPGGLLFGLKCVGWL